MLCIVLLLSMCDSILVFIIYKGFDSSRDRSFDTDDMLTSIVLLSSGVSADLYGLYLCDRDSMQLKNTPTLSVFLIIDLHHAFLHQRASPQASKSVSVVYISGSIVQLFDYVAVPPLAVNDYVRSYHFQGLEHHGEQQSHADSVVSLVYLHIISTYSLSICVHRYIIYNRCLLYEAWVWIS